MALQTLQFPNQKMNSITTNTQSLYPFNSNYSESKINIPYYTTHVNQSHNYKIKEFTSTPTTCALLSSLTTKLEEEVTNKILHKLNLKKHDTNNITLVTMCKLIDEITHIIKNDMKNMSKQNIQSVNALQFDQKQVIDNNKIIFSKILNKMKQNENNQQLIFEKLNFIQQQQNQMIIVNKKHQNMMINQMNYISQNLDDKSNTLLNNLEYHQKQILQELNGIKINNNNQFKVVNKKLQSIKKESNVLNGNFKHQLKQLNILNTTSTTLLDNVKCFKFNTLINEKKLNENNKKQKNNKNNIMKNIKSVKIKQSNGKITKLNGKNKTLLNFKKISIENNKVNQNIELKEELSKVNINFKKLNDKFDDVIISHKKIIISQKIMMSNIKKVKENMGNIANNNNNNTFDKSIVDNIQNKIDQLICIGIDNHDNNIDDTIGLLDDYNKLYNISYDIEKERDTYCKQLHGIENIFKKNETIPNELKKEVFNCLYQNENELTLISNDFIEFKINKNILKLSELLDILHKGDEKNNTIYNPNLSGNILQEIIEYMVYKFSNQDIIDVNVNDMTDWEKNFMNKNMFKNYMDIVIYAAGYLGIQSLLHSIKNYIDKFINGNEVCNGTMFMV